MSLSQNTQPIPVEEITKHGEVLRIIKEELQCGICFSTPEANANGLLMPCCKKWSCKNCILGREKSDSVKCPFCRASHKKRALKSHVIEEKLSAHYLNALGCHRFTYIGPMNYEVTNSQMPDLNSAQLDPEGLRYIARTILSDNLTFNEQNVDLQVKKRFQLHLERNEDRLMKSKGQVEAALLAHLKKAPPEKRLPDWLQEDSVPDDEVEPESCSQMQPTTSTQIEDAPAVLNLADDEHFADLSCILSLEDETSPPVQYSVEADRRVRKRKMPVPPNLAAMEKVDEVEEDGISISTFKTPKRVPKPRRSKKKADLLTDEFTCSQLQGMEQLNAQFEEAAGTSLRIEPILRREGSPEKKWRRVSFAGTTQVHCAYPSPSVTLAPLEQGGPVDDPLLVAKGNSPKRRKSPIKRSPTKKKCNTPLKVKRNVTPRKRKTGKSPENRDNVNLGDIVLVERAPYDFDEVMEKLKHSNSGYPFDNIFTLSDWDNVASKWIFARVAPDSKVSPFDHIMEHIKNSKIDGYNFPEHKAQFIDKLSVEKSRVLDELSVEKSPVLDELSVEKSRVLDELSVEKSPVLDELSVDKSHKLSVERSRVLDELSVEKSPVLDELSVKKSPVLDELSVEKSPVLDELSVKKSPVLDELSVKKSPVLDELSVEKSPVLDELSVEKSPVLDELSVKKSPVLDELSVEKSPVLDELSVEKSPVLDELSVENIPSFHTPCDLMEISESIHFSGFPEPSSNVQHVQVDVVDTAPVNPSGLLVNTTALDAQIAQMQFAENIIQENINVLQADEGSIAMEDDELEPTQAFQIDDLDDEHEDNTNDCDDETSKPITARVDLIQNMDADEGGGNEVNDADANVVDDNQHLHDGFMEGTKDNADASHDYIDALMDEDEATNTDALHDNVQLLKDVDTNVVEQNEDYYDKGDYKTPADDTNGSLDNDGSGAAEGLSYKDIFNDEIQIEHQLLAPETMPINQISPKHCEEAEEEVVDEPQLSQHTEDILRSIYDNGDFGLDRNLFSEYPIALETIPNALAHDETTVLAEDENTVPESLPQDEFVMETQIIGETKIDSNDVLLHSTQGSTNSLAFIKQQYAENENEDSFDLDKYHLDGGMGQVVNSPPLAIEPFYSTGASISCTAFDSEDRSLRGISVTHTMLDGQLKEKLMVLSKAFKFRVIDSPKAMDFESDTNLTHVVVGAMDRNELWRYQCDSRCIALGTTSKVFMGLCRAKFIISSTWIEKCFEKKTALKPDHFEIEGIFSRIQQRIVFGGARTSRLGAIKPLEYTIFHVYGLPFHSVNPDYSAIEKADIICALRGLGAHVVDNIDFFQVARKAGHYTAAYFITDPMACTQYQVPNPTDQDVAAYHETRATWINLARDYNVRVVDLHWLYQLAPCMNMNEQPATPFYLPKMDHASKYWMK